MQTEYPSPIMPMSPQKKGFQREDFAYKQALVEFPTADEILLMIEKNKHLMTGQTVQLLKMFVHGCASKDAVLTNFPTMADVRNYKMEHEIAARKLKICIPGIDAQNPIFHFILSILDWTVDPRNLRGYQGFDRNKQNEERIFHEVVSNRVDKPEKSSVFDVRKKKME